LHTDKHRFGAVFLDFIFSLVLLIGLLALRHLPDVEAIPDSYRERIYNPTKRPAKSRLWNYNNTKNTFDENRGLQILNYLASTELSLAKFVLPYSFDYRNMSKRRAQALFSV